MLYKLVLLTKCFFTILLYTFASLYLRERLVHFAHNVTVPVPSKCFGLGCSVKTVNCVADRYYFIAHKL